MALQENTNSSLFKMIKKIPITLTLLFFSFFIIIAAASDPVRSEEHAPPDTQQLIAQWQRTDGPYLVDIRKINQDETLDAAYYNPNTINVSRALLTKKNGQLNIFIELRDRGYSGSTYTLTYLPKNDTLAGEYFQAGMKRTFDVIFLRRKN